jgi:hypothetical protein
MVGLEERDIQKHLECSKKLRASFKKNPAKAIEFLIKAGILDSTGKKLSQRYRW